MIKHVFFDFLVRGWRVAGERFHAGTRAIPSSNSAAARTGRPVEFAETAGLAHDSVRAAGTGAPRCSSKAASLWSNSRPTLVIWGVLKLPNWVLGRSTVNHV